MFVPPNQLLFEYTHTKREITRQFSLNAIKCTLIDIAEI